MSYAGINKHPSGLIRTSFLGDEASPDAVSASSVLRLFRGFRSSRELENRCKVNRVVSSERLLDEALGSFKGHRGILYEGRKAIRPRGVLSLLLVLIAAFASAASAQEMEARSYSRAPVGSNIALFVYSHQSGDVLLDPALPLRDVNVNLNSTVVGYGYTFNLAGRQATASAALPYVWGRVRGTVFEQQEEVTRSGLGDVRLRLGVNLIGSPALSPREFAARKPSTVLGTSLSVVVPAGQYDPRRLVNLGSNRWAFKPELGLSQPLGRWTLELAGGAWFYSDNKDFFGGSHRKQKPLASVQGHVIYTLRPRMWLAVNATFYAGGQTTVDDTVNADRQKNSRVGATYSFPLAPQHSVKVSWAKGVTARIGGHLNTIAVGYQYTWMK